MFKTSEECDLELVAHTTMLPIHKQDGEVEWYESREADMLPVYAARASFGKQDKTGDNPAADIKLMNFLAEHGHLTPFEYQHATFLIECPLFIRSQIHRHRTFSYNEISRRYTEENLAFWIPDTFRKQSSSNKQASTNEQVGQYMYTEESHGVDETPLGVYSTVCDVLLETYNDMLDHGICREQARAVLPQSLLTQFYMGGNLRNWAHFIALRVDEHAQKEVQIVANKIAEKLRELWPESCNALGI